MTELHIPFVDLKAQYLPLKEEIRQAWDAILDSMQLFLGPNVKAFEREFAQYCEVEHAIGVSDGTDALQLALLACGVCPGDEVITVSHTFIATVEAILLVGAKPVFVDIDLGTYTMDVSQIESKITPKTRAILPVHLYGQCADMDAINEIARRHGLAVIEDACQAHGAQYKGRKAGSLGMIAAFSFYFSKNLGAYGEGGMVTTNDTEIARKVRLLRDHGSEKRYYHEEVGFNGRLDELQAAALRIKLRHLDVWNNQRRKNAAHYARVLANSQVQIPIEADGNRHVYHLFVVRTKAREQLRQFLTDQGIGTGIHYPVPVHLQKACAGLGYGPGSLPVTETVTSQILSLPMFAELTGQQIEQVAAAVLRFEAEASQPVMPTVSLGSIPISPSIS